MLPCFKTDISSSNHTGHLWVDQRPVRVWAVRDCVGKGQRGNGSMVGKRCEKCWKVRP